MVKNKQKSKKQKPKAAVDKRFEEGRSVHQGADAVRHRHHHCFSIKRGRRSGYLLLNLKKKKR